MSLTWCMGSQMAGGGASRPQFHPSIRGFLSLPQNTFLRLKSSTVWLESVGASSTTRLTSCVSFTPVGHRDLASVPSLPPPRTCPHATAPSAPLTAPCSYPFQSLSSRTLRTPCPSPCVAELLTPSAAETSDAPCFLLLPSECLLSHAAPQLPRPL